MKKIMILGAGIYQVPLIKTARRLGLYTIAVSIPGDYPGFAYADKVYYINTTDKEAVLKAALDEQIDGICTTGTDVAVSSIGYVCEHMKLAGISEAAALLATNKADMKAAFKAAGVSTARFFKASGCEEVCRAASEIGFPVVVKCVDSSGSRGITIAWEKKQLKQALKNALAHSRQNYVLVEEMLTGTEIGVDGMVQNGRLVFLAPHEKYVYHSGDTAIPEGHSFPYHGSPDIQQEIARQMQMAVDALQLDACAVNADVFVSGGRVSIIEIGGRTGATCIPELISMYCGFDYYEKIIRNALGEPLDFIPQPKKQPCMAKLLMSPINGTITSVNEEKLAAMQSRSVQVQLDYSVGHSAEQMRNGTNRIGHIVAAVSDPVEFDRLRKEAYDAIFVDGKSLKELWNTAGRQ